jgi:hypothetical protein
VVILESQCEGPEVDRWTPPLRDRKIDQLASVIAAMNTGQGPDLLGVCEVENRFVVDRLIDRVNATLPGPRNYEVVHPDTDDARGIDVAFDDTLFQVPPPLEQSVFFHVVMRRNATWGDRSGQALSTRQRAKVTSARKTRLCGI